MNVKLIVSIGIAVLLAGGVAATYFFWDQMGRARKSDNAAAVAAPPAPGAAPSPQVGAVGQLDEGPWAFGCNEQTKLCQIHQNVIARETGNRILTVVVREKPDNNGKLILFSLPHGVYLPAGVTLLSNGQNIGGVQFQGSEEIGPYATADLNEATLQLLQNESSGLEVMVEDVNRQSFRVPLTLSGFAEAYAKFEAD